MIRVAVRMGWEPERVLGLTARQALAYENEANAIEAERTNAQLTNLNAAISAAFSKEGGRLLEQWRDVLEEQANGVMGDADSR